MLNQNLTVREVVEQFGEMLAQRVAEKIPAHPVSRARLLTVEQAAAYLGRSKASLRHLISQKQLPAVRSDRRVFLDIRDLDVWIEKTKGGQ